MRACIFRKLLRYLEEHDPALFKRFQLQVLLNVTARAFGVPGRWIWHLSPKRALREYAVFTKNCMQFNRVNPRRLYRSAYALGRRLRHITGFTDSRELQQLVFFLYRNIRIIMKGSIPGEVTVSTCYFSRFYTPEQCALMSYVDWGIIAGLCGGGHLKFTERITEGCGRCTAVFSIRKMREPSKTNLFVFLLGRRNTK